MSLESVGVALVFAALSALCRSLRSAWGNARLLRRKAGGNAALIVGQGFELVAFRCTPLPYSKRLTRAHFFAAKAEGDAAWNVGRAVATSSRSGALLLYSKRLRRAHFFAAKAGGNEPWNSGRAGSELVALRCTPARCSKRLTRCAGLLRRKLEVGFGLCSTYTVPATHFCGRASR
jgi:hypothetical protein